VSSPELDRQLVAPDGTRIAYGATGSGPALLLTNGLTTDTTFWKYLAPRWSQHHTVICWDLPGHGKSDPARSPHTATVEAQPGLMHAILDRLGIERALQIGWSTGCQVVLELYRQYPERCSAIALLFGGAGRVLDTTRLPLPGPWFAALVRALPPKLFALFCRAMARAAAEPPIIPLARRLGLIGPRTSEDDVRRVLAHLGTVDPLTLRQMLLSVQAHSAHDVLPRVRVPFLIFAGDRDPFASSEQVGVAMHAAAPRSELIRLPEGTHTALLDEAEIIGRAVENLALEAR
jgi:pimeloyl-ACP methyl ester carboxylesterase